LASNGQSTLASNVELSDAARLYRAASIVRSTPKSADDAPTFELIMTRSDKQKRAIELIGLIKI